jgi:hypothetical protein
LPELLRTNPRDRRYFTCAFFIAEEFQIRGSSLRGPHLCKDKNGYRTLQNDYLPITIHGIERFEIYFDHR